MRIRIHNTVTSTEYRIVPTSEFYYLVGTGIGNYLVSISHYSFDVKDCTTCTGIV